MTDLLGFLYNCFAFLESTLGHYFFLLVITSAVFLFKSYITFNLLVSKNQSRSAVKCRILLLLVIIGSMIGDLAWMLKLSQALFFPTLAGFFIGRFIKFAWAMAVVQYHSLALFIESLPYRKKLFGIKNIIFVTISATFFILFLCCAIFPSGTITSEENFMRIERLFHCYAIFVLLPISLLLAIYRIRQVYTPLLLQQQTKALIQIFIIPQLISDFLQFYRFNFSPGYIASSFAFVGISTMFLTIATYFCARKIMGLRFLNFTEHVQSAQRYGFVDRIKDALGQLSQTTNVKDLHQITQHFFSHAFAIPKDKVKLHLRVTTYGPQIREITDPITTTVENLLLSNPKQLDHFLQESNILIYDEIVFTNFYEEDCIRSCAITFLQQINTDIFIPIYKDQELIAYITINRYARASNQFYSDVERDEMIVFSQYLSNVIHLIQHRSLAQLVENERALQEELYQKQQELAQYKEGLHALLHTSKTKEIGVLFYRSRRFLMGNSAAQKLVGIDLATHAKHPVNKKLKQIAELAQENHGIHTCYYTDAQGNKIIARAMPSISHNHIIITLHYADACDLIKDHIDHLKNPSQWDYLLYLETTKSGQLINQLIPGSGQTLLTFKIDLLRVALSKKALLLDMPENDLLSAVEILHHIGLRDQLHVLKLQEPTSTHDIMTKLFGINPLLGLSTQRPILETLSGADTLFIQNIHFLDFESQEHLAELIRYGFYRMFKSDQKKTSAVRIICSTNQELSILTHERKFSANLFNELKRTSITMPSLLTLSESELYELAQGFGQQALHHKENSTNLELSQREISSIAGDRPVSLHEFKNRVQQLVKQKSQSRQLYVETVFNPARMTTDAELLEIAQLGKHAMRDPKIMALLWNKFKNQNKIAHFLGVNRSSVNRRCKKYNLE